MVEDKKNTTKKKTLSLKIGSSIKSNPIQGFESGATVVVERKRVRKVVPTTNIQDLTETEKKVSSVISPSIKESIEKVPEVETKQLKKSGVILKRLSKEEQSKAEKAALSTAKYLWNFLSGIAAKHNLQAAA